jgi:hypothetical protein
MATKKAAAKKSAPKKTAAKKAAPEKATAKKSTPRKRPTKKTEAQKRAQATTDFAEIALVRNSHLGSGRERDERAKMQGLDPAEVRAEMHRIRVDRVTNNS